MGRQIDMVQKFTKMDSPHCSTATKSKHLLLRLGETPDSQGGSYSCRCSTTSPVDQETTKKERESNAQLVFLYAKRFGAGQWSFLGPGSEKK